MNSDGTNNRIKKKDVKKIVEFHVGNRAAQ